MLSSGFGLAFLMGIVSALSLPLGTLTTLVWRPSERMVALLMAFGGGALLAALTIDLVAEALEDGHFYQLAAGCLAGGLLFDLLNHTINRKGGFLRKSSTMIHYLARQRRQRFRQIISRLERLPLFQGLPDEESQYLASIVYSVEYDAGESVFEQGDPSDALYVLDEGRIQLLEEADAPGTLRLVKPVDCFGRLSFFTASPRVFTAVAAKDSRVWVIEEGEFAEVVAACPTLAARLQDFLEGEEVAGYLKTRFGLSAEHVREWTVRAAASLAVGSGIPAAVDVERNAEEFDQIADHIGRLPIFEELSFDEHQAIAEHLFLRHVPRGQPLFRQGEPADRLFIVEHGEVALVNGEGLARSPETIGAGNAFGGLSFLTRAPHSVTAVTTTDAAVWVLRRIDFDRLLRRLPGFEGKVRAFLQDDRMTSYLRERRHFDAGAAARWTERAARSLALTGALPPSDEMTREMKKHGGAPLAIWLGITLDGIPESLVIGASMIHSSLSLSLLAGLFLSNYPEALSSSMGMRHQGMRFGRVLLMWGSVTLLTGIGAALGNLFFVGADKAAFALVQGVAAGAMLTMIAETMLPEAYLKGGPPTGFTTLLGFLAAIFFKTLE